jgi:hypothetical protein
MKFQFKRFQSLTFNKTQMCFQLEGGGLTCQGYLLLFKEKLS